MDRMDLNTGFATRVAAERALMTTNGDLGDHNGKVCPGTNIKPDDDVTVVGSVVRVLGGKLNDPTVFLCAWMDWSIPNSFTTGEYPIFVNDAPSITDRAPADPQDTDPIYVEPEPSP